MFKELLTEKEGVALSVMFIIGSTLVAGGATEAGQDAWISIILAMIMALPVLTIYARLLHLFPGKDVFAIIDHVCGPYIGKVLSILFVWYAFHLGALVLRNFSEFLKEVSMTETPGYVIDLPMILLCIWAVKGGIKVLGRWAGLIFTVLLFIILTTEFLSFTRMNLGNLKPFFYKGALPVVDGAFTVFSFPFAETVLLISVFSSLNSSISPYKMYYLSLLTGGTLIFILVLRNISSLGFPYIATQYFPSYIAVSLINAGQFIQRIEVVVSITFLLSGIVKVSICLYGASVGIARILDFKDYSMITAPVGLLMVNLSTIIYTSMQEMFEWIKIYRYYAIPFQIILPIIIWIGAEIKTRSQKTA
jgi:spore germination protein KB